MGRKITPVGLPPQASLVMEATLFLKENLVEIFKENEITKRHTAEIEGQTKVLIAKIKEDGETYRYALDHIFGERSKTIQKNCELIDHGIAQNDDKLIALGVNSLSALVTSNPFFGIVELGNLLDSGGKIEL